MQINIIEVISDTMYSDSEMIMDSLAALLETLLLRHIEDGNVLESLKIVGSVVNNMLPSPDVNSSTLQSIDQSLNSEVEERKKIAIELVSAIGFQRFRFNERLAKGESVSYLEELYIAFITITQVHPINLLLIRKEILMCVAALSV